MTPITERADRGEGIVSAEKCVEIATRIKMAPGEEAKIVHALIDPESAESPIVRHEFV